MATVVSNLVIQLQVQGAPQAKAQVAAVQSQLAQLLGMGAQGAAAGAGAAVGAGSVLSVFSAVAAGIRLVVHAMKDFMDLQREIETIKNLTGSTTKEAGGLAVGLHATGVSDPQAIRDLTHMSTAMSSARGLGALRLLGVKLTPGESGVKVFMDMVTQLDLTQDGMRKTAVLAHILGTRGVAQLEPMLHLSKELKEEWANLADTFDTRGPQIVREFAGAWGFFQTTFEQDVIGPFLNELLPVLTLVIETATRAMQSIHDLLGDDLTGVLEIAAAFTAIAAAIAIVTGGVIALTAALAPLLAALAGISLGAVAITGLAAALGIGAFGIGEKIGKSLFGGHEEEDSRNMKRTADYLEDIKGHLLGNTGPRGRRTVSEIEADYVLAHALGKGFA